MLVHTIRRESRLPAFLDAASCTVGGGGADRYIQTAEHVAAPIVPPLSQLRAVEDMRELTGTRTQKCHQALDHHHQQQ